MYYLWSVFNTTNEMKNRPLIMREPQAHKKLNPSLLVITQEKNDGVKMVLSYRLQQNVSVELHMI